MKILYYNWTQFDKKNNSGGGVNVYQKNLIQYLIKNTSNEVFFISSGIYYDTFKSYPYIKETKNIFGNRCRTFKIINSKCTAPAKAMYNNVETYLNDETTYELLKQFINQYGKFDVIHFNNIEGLSAKCLEIKKDYPETKVIYSIHNYALFCPQVNLFFNNESNCGDYNNGLKCCQCLKTNISQKRFIAFYKIDSVCEKLHMENISNKIKISLKKINKCIHKKQKEDMNTTDKKKNNMGYCQYRQSNVKKINDYVDIVLAVSERVRNIAIKMGIDEKKIYTNYIGTEFARNNIDYTNKTLNKENINIAYMGYFEKAKGLEFLLEALEILPTDIAKKINFLCYARIKDTDDEEHVKRINNLNQKLHLAKHYNGYDHKELQQILSNIDLGIVPVIWEDNLPQVAIEYVAHGVPVLCSDLGGAHELSSSKYFIYKAGNKQDFIDKIEKIINNREILDDYFKKRIKLTTMDEHVEKLLAYYKKEQI
ncbi:MAG TPA: glycosyltransferase family 4 protein [Clostridiaceae bacterium]|nr:glycosyltransferase family 4 protein [Clostridiaceae bacterium]